MKLSKLIHLKTSSFPKVSEMAKKESNGVGKGSTKGSDKEGAWRGKASHGDSDKGHWRGSPSGGGRSQGKGSDDKPMIHVEPDNPWPRK